MSSYTVRSSVPGAPSNRRLEFPARRTSVQSLARDDSDDENMLGPPKLSNFGSALLSDKENVEPYPYSRNQSVSNAKRYSQPPRAAARPETFGAVREFSSSNTNNSVAGPYSTFHSEEHSDSTMFATSKHNQQSMTTFNPETPSEQGKPEDMYLEKSRSRVKSMQQTLRDELSLRSSKRRNRRFVSSRFNLLGPAKRASSDTGTPNHSELADESNVSQQEANFSHSSSAGATAHRNEYNVFYESQNSSSPQKDSAAPTDHTSINYDNIEFGDLNPYQYLKKHNIPTTELPNISRLYFERQKGENRKTALRKNIAAKDAFQTRLTSASLSNSPLLKHVDLIKREQSIPKRQPRRKISDHVTNNDSKAWSSPVSSSKGLKTAPSRDGTSPRASEMYENIERPERDTFGSIRRREALSNININSNYHQLQNKRTKYSTENLEEARGIHRPPFEHSVQEERFANHGFKHRSPPAVPERKHVEIVEPLKTTESIPLKPPATSGDNYNRRKPTIYVNGTEYEKLELLGRGGSSKVYKVKNVANNKVYALKRVSFDEFDDSSIEGFKGEIELLKKLETKPRVVKLIDHEMDHGVLYEVMECGDHDLSHTLALRSGMGLDVEFVRFHSQEMLKCVKVVHDSGIVHSDLKPANFVFVKGILKIIDFGIANAVPEHTVNIYRETQIGTPNYMAPEALVAMNYTQGQPAEQNRWKVGKPSDIWSCGCIIYQMIYGRPPYGGFQGQNRLLAIMNPEVKIVYPEKTSNGDVVPKTAIDTMKACLERNPEKRWSVDEVLNGPFVKPIAVTHFFIRDLIKNSVKYGANQREISNEKIEELAEDVWHRLADFRL
ncbi:Protein kinase domain-containing protein [Lachancea thermotolerans]